MDVAASLLGRTIRFQEGVAADFPNCTLARQVIWTGQSTVTATKLGTFAGFEDPAVDRLCASASELFETPNNLALLAEYTDDLKNLDDTAALGIFSDAHGALSALAKRQQLVYKPSGAGGGDIGIVFSKDPETLISFAQDARSAGFFPLDLEESVNGLEVRA